MKLTKLVTLALLLAFTFAQIESGTEDSRNPEEEEEVIPVVETEEERLAREAREKEQ